MMLNKFVVIAGLLLSLVACSSAPPAPETRELVYKGFALTLPADSQWHETHNSPYQVTLVKPGAKKYERYTIQALVVKLPTFASDEDFMNFIKKSMTANDRDARRKAFEQSVSLVTSKTDQCVQYRSKSEDRSVSIVVKNAEPMILEMVNFTCRHPTKKGAGVYLAFARRYFSDSVQEDLNSQAMNIFHSLDFTEI